jgi:hypothetical protein
MPVWRMNMANEAVLVMWAVLEDNPRDFFTSLDKSETLYSPNPDQELG